MVGPLAGLARLPQRPDPHLGQQRQHFQKNFPGDDRVAQRRVASEDRDPEAFGDGLETMAGLVRMQDGREQQRVEYRLFETHARLLLLQLQEAHVESGVVPDQHRVGAEGVKLGQDAVDERLSDEQFTRDAVYLDRLLRQPATRIDQLVEALMTKQPTIDDPRRPDLDDLVSLRRLQTSRFSIEDGIAQLHQRAIVEFMAGSRPAEDIEIIEFGTLTLACGDDRPRQILRRLGGR